MKRIFTAAVLTTGLLLSSWSAQALSTGSYTLGNHPDGNAAPPLYGLRLDGLLGDPTKEFTFDFDDSRSNMTLTWDGSKIVIDGQAFGGEDTGAGYGVTAIWDVHFEYTVGVATPGGDGGVPDVVVTAHHQNFGTLSSSLGSFNLRDHADGGGISFNLGDEVGLGHRGFTGISGWGWLDHCNTALNKCGTDGTDWHPSHISASDWLFTAAPVPVPAAVWLFGTGLIALVGIARRRG